VKLRHRYWLGICCPLIVLLSIIAISVVLGAGWLIPIAFLAWVVSGVLLKSAAVCPACNTSVLYRGVGFAWVVPIFGVPDHCYHCGKDLTDE